MSEAEFLESVYYRVKGIPTLFEMAWLADQKKIPNINSRFIDECESIREQLGEVVQIGEQAGHPMRKTELLFMAMGGEGDPSDELIRESLVEVQTQESKKPTNQNEPRWIRIQALNDLKQYRGTIGRHADDESMPWIRKTDEGYEIREDRIDDYLKPSKRKEYGLD